MSDIREFQITWKRDLFFKNKSTLLTAQYLVKKSIVIGQVRLCRQLKDLKMELQTAQHDRQILKNSLGEHLQQRLQILKNEIDNHNCQINNLTKQEKEYWKQLAQIIEKRTNSHRSNTQPIVIVNKTYVIHTDKNDENRPPLKCDTKVPKSRKKKNCIS